MHVDQNVYLLATRQFASAKIKYMPRYHLVGSYHFRCVQVRYSINILEAMEPTADDSEEMK